MITITKAGSRRAQAGPETFFTGTVRVEPLFDPQATMHPAAASVTFEPCARSAWHTHPRGQMLVVTHGVGRVQEWGGPVQEIRPGDVIWTPPGVKHWHGASADSAMTHIALQEPENGTPVTWMEKVTDEQYNAIRS